MTETPSAQPAVPPAEPNPAILPALAGPVLDSAQIFQGTREVAIRHGSETYRLRLTKANKLILHK